MKRLLIIISAFVLLSVMGCSVAESTTTADPEITLSITHSQYVNATPIELFTQARDYWQEENGELIHHTELGYFVTVRYCDNNGNIVDKTLIITEEIYNALQGKTRIALKIE